MCMQPAIACEGIVEWKHCLASSGGGVALWTNWSSVGLSRDFIGGTTVQQSVSIFQSQHHWHFSATKRHHTPVLAFAVLQCNNASASSG
jgi:hypothetical protein